MVLLKGIVFRLKFGLLEPEWIPYLGPLQLRPLALQVRRDLRLCCVGRMPSALAGRRPLKTLWCMRAPEEMV